MYYVYRRSSSTSARVLAEALEGYRVRNRAPRRALATDDVVVCWGEDIPDWARRSRILNPGVVQSKFSQAVRLRERGVSTIEVVRERTPIHAEWLGRSDNHTGGSDLLRHPTSPDYWVRRENLIEEYRVHSFAGKSIRAGVKVPREGFSEPHAWVRSWDGGWRISYATNKIKQAHRDIAHAAVAALGLTFGAVDIGQRRDGRLVVLEVNRAPGVEGGSIGAYARAIQGWRG